MSLTPTLDCYILVIGASDSSIDPRSTIFYLRKLFKYNSLTDKTFFHQNQNTNSNSFEVQIPDFALEFLGKKELFYILDNAEQLIETKKRFISYRPKDNTWYVNTGALYGNPL
jgi:hypothetical protein